MWLTVYSQFNKNWARPATFHIYLSKFPALMFCADCVKMTGTARTVVSNSFIFCCLCFAGFTTLLSEWNPEIYLENAEYMKVITTYTKAQLHVVIQCRCYHGILPSIVSIIIFYCWISLFQGQWQLGKEALLSECSKFETRLEANCLNCLIGALRSEEWLVANLILNANFAGNDLAESYCISTVEQALILNSVAVKGSTMSKGHSWVWSSTPSSRELLTSKALIESPLWDTGKLCDTTLVPYSHTHTKRWTYTHTHTHTQYYTCLRDWTNY